MLLWSEKDQKNTTVSLQFTCSGFSVSHLLKSQRRSSTRRSLVTKQHEKRASASSLTARPHGRSDTNATLPHILSCSSSRGQRPRKPGATRLEQLAVFSSREP